MFGSCGAPCLVIVLWSCFCQDMAMSKPGPAIVEEVLDAVLSYQNRNRASREEEEYDFCRSALMCPSQDLGRPSGDILHGIDYSMELLTGICTFAEEYLACYDEAAQRHACGEYSTLYANVSHMFQNNLCQIPNTDKQSMLICINSRVVQVSAFGEFKEMLGRMLTYREVNITAGMMAEKMCYWQSYYVEYLMDVVGRNCGRDEFTLICDMTTELLPILEWILRVQKCPTGTFSTCRYSYHYNHKSRG